jgi:hypothetical protein
VFRNESFGELKIGIIDRGGVVDVDTMVLSTQPGETIHTIMVIRGFAIAKIGYQGKQGKAHVFARCSRRFVKQPCSSPIEGVVERNAVLESRRIASIFHAQCGEN